MRGRSVLVAVLGAALVGPPGPAWGAPERVVPSERVRSGVNVRERASVASPVVGRLQRGEEAELLASSAGWHRVELGDGRAGWVSADWTQVLPAAEEPDFDLRADRVERGFGARLGHFFRHRVFGFVGSPARAEFAIDYPDLGSRTRRHYDPHLPVAGFATTPGQEARYDIALVIDTSTSTNEFAQTDVDGDGQPEDEWQGDDSILRAQCLAATNFVRALRRLPGNRAGERIRVAIVTFAGSDRYAGRPEDADFDPTPVNLFRLSSRDAEVRARLTDDYDALERELARLAEIEPSGMTDFAAGIARAVVELEGLDALGGRSEPRPAAKVIQFLTDGKPRLPYDREVAERATRHAVRLASDLGIRINAFELGHNAVTREVNSTLKRISRDTSGRFVHLEQPGDIVSILEATQFAFVDRVKLVNLTADQETDYIATGIDGSFYGEIPLLEGENEIELVAVLPDDREASDRLRVRFTRVPREEELARELARIRRENEALIEQLRQQLAREVREARSARRESQDKEVELHR